MGRRGLVSEGELVWTHLAVHVGRTDREHPLHAGFASRPKHVEGAFGVGPECDLWGLPAAPHIRCAGEVVHHIGCDLAEALEQGRSIENVEAVGGAVRGQGIVAGVLQVTLQMGAHEPAGAGDQGSHRPNLTATPGAFTSRADQGRGGSIGTAVRQWHPGAVAPSIVHP